MAMSTGTSKAVQALDASLNEDLEALRRDGLFRPLRVLEFGTGTGGGHRRQGGDQPFQQQLSRPQHPPPLVEAATRQRNGELGPGRCAPSRAPRPSMRNWSFGWRIQGHPGFADLPERLRRQRRCWARCWRVTRCQRPAQPRQHHRRDSPDQGPPLPVPSQGHGGPRRAPGRGPRRRCQADSDRDRRGLQHGRRYRTPARDLWTWPSRRRRGHGGRRPRLGSPGAQWPGFGRPLPAGGQGPDPGRDAEQGGGGAGRLRRRLRRTCARP